MSDLIEVGDPLRDTVQFSEAPALNDMGQIVVRGRPSASITPGTEASSGGVIYLLTPAQ